MMSSITFEGVLKFVVGVAIAALVAFLVWFFSSVVVYILISAVLAVMFRRVVALLLRFKISGREMSRGFAAVFTLFAIWGLFALLFAMLVPLTFSKLHELSNLNLSSALHSVEEPIHYMQHYIQNLFSLPESDFALGDSLVKYVSDFVDMNMVNNAFSSIVGVAMSSVIAFFSISFITFFFLKDDGLFSSMVSSLFPQRYTENVVRALDSISFLLSRYFIGILTESAIIASLISIVMICFGMSTQDSLFIGLVMGVLNVIPYAGPFIGSVISIFLAVLSPIASMGVGGTVMLVICTLSIIKGLDDFLLQPTLYSERVKAHPLEVFLVILLSGHVAGILGMLLAIPSYTVIRVFAKEFFSQFSFVQRLTKEI